MKQLLTCLILASALVLSACGDKGDRAIDEQDSSTVSIETTATAE